MPRRIVLCATQVPFAHGGAEVLVDSLAAELGRRGFACEVVRLPFAWGSRLEVLESALAWRLLNLQTLAGEAIDLVIATRFPAYLIRHPNKVVWLIHQFRQVYELRGTPYSEYGDSAEDRRTAAMVRAMDRRALSEARALYSISRNTAARLERYNGLTAEALYPPPPLGDAYRQGPAGDYVFAVGRLDRMKRFDLLLQAMRHTESGVRCILAGSGPEEERLAHLVERHGLAGKVELAGRVDDQRLVELYAGSLAVFYAPFDEDYGYVTVEAFKAGKAVVTAADAGGVLELVEDGVNGLVCPAAAPRRLPRRLAQRLDHLFERRDEARRLGAAGRRRVAEIGWDEVVERLTGGLAP